MYTHFYLYIHTHSLSLFLHTHTLICMYIHCYVYKITLQIIYMYIWHRGGSCGGIIFNPGGNQVSNFTWELGMAINNQRKLYSLLQGVQIAVNAKIETSPIFRDSMIIIHHKKSTSPTSETLASILARIR